jgi:hypothetical protein
MKNRSYYINIEVDNDHFEEITVVAKNKKEALIKIKKEIKKREIILNNKYGHKIYECIYEIKGGLCPK